jgi:hypothetical protein
MASTDPGPQHARQLADAPPMLTPAMREQSDAAPAGCAPAQAMAVTGPQRPLKAVTAMQPDVTSHGTPAASWRHYPHFEKPCEPCRAAAPAAQSAAGRRPRAISDPGARGAILHGMPIAPCGCGAPWPARGLNAIQRAEARYGWQHAPCADSGAA